VEDIGRCSIPEDRQLNREDFILIVAIASPHWKEAFEACEYALECMRNMDSVKKKEGFE
jgi:molybdopterin synthase catalytic subunit